MSNGAPIVGNQKLILNIFFKNLDPVSKFKFLTSIDRSRFLEMQREPVEG
jgi:hypothetical protein